MQYPQILCQYKFQQCGYYANTNININHINHCSYPDQGPSHHREQCLANRVVWLGAWTRAQTVQTVFLYRQSTRPAREPLKTIFCVSLDTQPTTKQLNPHRKTKANSKPNSCKKKERDYKKYNNNNSLNFLKRLKTLQYIFEIHFTILFIYLFIFIFIFFIFTYFELIYFKKQARK